MKHFKERKLLFFYFLIFISCEPKNKQIQNNETLIYTEELAQEHLKAIEDSAKWDVDIFKDDLKNKLDFKTGPFEGSVYPVPNYDLIGKGSFKGLGNQQGFKKSGGKDLVFNSFFIKENTFNKKFLNGKKDEVFFTILLLTDSLDTVNYDHSAANITSRNHPNYIGQGYFETKTLKVDYSAFITVNRETFAIVNMRLFDLKNGKTIIIAPQKDKSLRSLQIKTPDVSSNKVDEVIDSLLKVKNINEFLFKKRGNI